DADGREYRRPPGAGRVALPLSRGQRRAVARPRGGARLPPRHPGRHRGALRARADAHGHARRLRGRAARLRLSRPSDGAARGRVMSRISRGAYAEMFGPTTGDRVRLGDTALIIEVESDRTVYGDEVKFGGGKVIRDGMGQSQRPSAKTADTVITNALIVDWWGIVKADVGIKDGRIAGLGKAGNPDTQAGIDIVIGPGTEIIAGEGQILTAGGI